FWRTHPNPYVKLFSEVPRGKNVILPPKIGIWPEYQAEMKNAFDEIALVHKTPKDALDYVQARMQPKFVEYRRRLRLRGELSESPRVRETPDPFGDPGPFRGPRRSPGYVSGTLSGNDEPGGRK